MASNDIGLAHGHVRIGTTAPTAALEVQGGIKSQMWKVTQLMNQTAGGLPKTSASFTTSGGTLMIFAFGSGYRGVAGAVGMDIQIDSVTKGSASVTSNEANSHKAFIPNTIIVTGIVAGSHTITLAPWANTTTDSNDLYSVVVTELPF